MPTISILLPTFNGAGSIRRATTSVTTQTFQDWELIIINDGSRDTTEAVIAQIAANEPRIRVFHSESNQGIQKALNKGLREARGVYSARIDDDDLWTDPKKLEKQLAYLTTHPDCVLVGTGIIVQDEAASELYRFLNPITDKDIRQHILYRNCFSHSTVMFKTSAALKFKGYDESTLTRHIEDYDLWLKLGTIGTFANLPEYAVRFTNRPGAISNKNKLQQFKNQLAITAQYRGQYPNYGSSRLKSYLRLVLYWLFGALVPARLQEKFIRYYKQ